MQLHFIPITSENRVQAEALEILPAQDGFVEPVAACLEEADRRKCWRPVGIYDGQTLVGFAMYGFFWEYLPFGRLWLDRLLIDRRDQGKGYGRLAGEGLLSNLWREYGKKKVYLRAFAENQQAIELYRSLGFRFNGQHDIHGEDVMVYIYPEKR